MGNLSGKHFQKISERINLFADSDTWIEGKAIQQLEKTTQLDGVFGAAGMPDLHPGRGYPIGAAFATKSIIYPALVGNDIGCGMSVWCTNIKIHKVNLDKFEKRLNGIDQPLSEDWKDTVAQRLTDSGLQQTLFKRALGTIGGGNHFAELQQLDKVIDQTAFNLLNIDKKKLILLVHSGSRGLGESILRRHVDNFGHKGLRSGTAEFDDYIAYHNQALNFAEVNRQFIALRMLKRLGAKGEVCLDVNHNLVSKNDKLGQDCWIHRKGATPADQGVVMIPGSRGDYSYLVMPLESAENAGASLYSLAHGAGRKWIRSECKDRLSNRYKRVDLERTHFGSRVICKNKTLIYEEAPEAYKSIDSVIQVMAQAGLIKVIARFKPVLTYKTAGACS